MSEQVQPPSNPLMSYSRQPEVYTGLPSRGQFNDPNDIDFTASEEIGVAPMTAADELAFKTPEGLLNGNSLARVIESCCFGINRPDNLVSPDIDVLLLAIRKASYGDMIDFDATCPKCGHQDTYSASITYLLKTIDYLESEYPVKLSNDVVVYLQPFTYQSSVKESLHKYNERQALRLLTDQDLSDEQKSEHFTESLTRMADLSIELTAGTIIKIVDPENKVLHVTFEQILEWIKVLPTHDVKLLQEKIAEINSVGVKPTQIKCTKCEHEWSSRVNFDPSHFFE